VILSPLPMSHAARARRTRRTLLALALVTSSTACAMRAGSTRSAAAPAPPEIAFLTGTPPEPGPFSRAVRVGHLLFLSGKIGTDSTGRRVVPGGVRAETRAIMEEIRRDVVTYGSSMDRVVKCLVMMADMREWPAMNEVYTTYFPGPKPARSALGANGLALDARVEIECIAVVR